MSPLLPWPPPYFSPCAPPHSHACSKLACLLPDMPSCLLCLPASPSTFLRPISCLCAGLLVRADNPEQLLTAYTSYSGRMQPLPTWIASGGAVISMTGGTEAVSAYYSTLKDNDVPMAALFVQVKHWRKQVHLHYQTPISNISPAMALGPCVEGTLVA